MPKITQYNYFYITSSDERNERDARISRYFFHPAVVVIYWFFPVVLFSNIMSLFS